MVASRLGVRFKECDPAFWLEASWFEDSTHGGNVYVSPPYLDLMGRACALHEWVLYVKNPEYVASYIDWRPRKDDWYWDHPLVWDHPQKGEIHLWSYAKKQINGGIQGVIRQRASFDSAKL